VSFPATILGSGLPLKLPDVIKGFNWLTFEGGKFSTSRGRGIFTDRALDLLPADAWRWWLAANAPEGSDCDFTVARFVDGVNKDLADTFGNLVNRCLTFAASAFGPTVPGGGSLTLVERELAHRLGRTLVDLAARHEALELRKAADEVRAIWKIANAYLAETAPWTVVKRDRDRAAAIVRTGINLVRTAAAAAWPFVPGLAAAVLRHLGEDAEPPSWTEDGQQALSVIGGGRSFTIPAPLICKVSAAEFEAASARPVAG
jgi:methionyl-tRNA synthetase